MTKLKHNELECNWQLCEIPVSTEVLTNTQLSRVSRRTRADGHRVRDTVVGCRCSVCHE